MGLIVVPLLFLYLVVAIFVTYKVARIPNTWPKKLLAGGLSMLVFVGLFAGDAIVGRVHLKNLCGKDGGITVNDTISISSKYFDEKGRFVVDIDKVFFGDGMLVDNQYLVKQIKTTTSTLPQLNRLEYQVVSKHDDVLLGKMVRYGFGGGWFESLGAGSGIKCPDYKPGYTQRDFYLKLFQKQSH